VIARAPKPSSLAAKQRAEGTSANRRCSSKTRAGDFLGKCPERAGQNEPQAADARRVARPESTKSASGVRYYGRRYYDPKDGRFVGRDPIAEQGGLNLYAFVMNNPANAWDYLGMNTPDDRPHPTSNFRPVTPNDFGPPIGQMDSRYREGGSGASAEDSMARIVQARTEREQHCETVNNLLDGDKSDLYDAIRNSIKTEGLSESEINRIVEDIGSLGQHGGDLGRSFFSHVIANGLTVAGTDDTNDEPNAVRNSNRIELNFAHPIYVPGVPDLRGEMHIYTDEEARSIFGADIAWNPEMIVAHELGHAVLGIPDPINVVVVQARVARSFSENGIRALTNPSYFGGITRPVWSENRDDFHVPSIYQGESVLLGHMLTEPGDLTAEEYIQRSRDEGQKVNRFINRWGCN